MAWLLTILLYFITSWLVGAIDYEFNGETYIIYNASAEHFSRTHSTIHLLFRTAKPEGILLHARGNNGDFTTIEIVRGKLRFASAFGRGGARPGTHDVIIGDDLGDDQWHQIDVERNRNHVVIKLDITRKYLTAGSSQKYQTIDRAINIAGIPSYTIGEPNSTSNPQMSRTEATFEGCMENVSFNEINIFKATKENSKEVNVWGTLHPKCSEDANYYAPVTLSKSTSYIELYGRIAQDIELRFRFRTFDQSGVLVHFGSSSTEELFLELERGKLRASFVIQNSTAESVIFPSSTIANGLWHKVELNLTSNGVSIQINNDSSKQFLNTPNAKDSFQNSVFKIGSDLKAKPAMHGCVKEIHLNGKDIEITSSISNDIDLDHCYLKDLCFNNPCLHNGVCKQYGDEAQCDCTNTGYSGVYCENISKPVHDKSLSTRNEQPNYTKPTSFSREKAAESSKDLPFGIKAIENITTGSIQASQTTARVLPTSIMPASPGNLPTTEKKIAKILPSFTRENISPKKSTPNFISKSKPASPTQRAKIIKPKHTTTLNTSETSIVNLKEFKSTSDEVSTIQIKPFTINTILPSTISTPLPTHSVQLALPTEQNPSTEQTPIQEWNTKIVIIEKSTTAEGFNKNQLLVYLILFIAFCLFIGLIVIFSVKLSYIQSCACLRRCQTVNGSIPSSHSMELGQHAKESDGVLSRGKSGRASSINDSGIDRSEFGTESNRSSALHDDVKSPSGELEPKLDEAREGFVILQEDPTVYTQRSFGWTAFDSSSTKRHCRTSTRDLVLAVNETKPPAFRSAYYLSSEVLEDVEAVPVDDVTET